MKTILSILVILFISLQVIILKVKNQKKWVEHRNVGTIVSNDGSSASLFECETPKDYLNLQNFVNQLDKIHNTQIIGWDKPLPDANNANNFYKFNCRPLFSLDSKTILFLSKNDLEQLMSKTNRSISKLCDSQTSEKKGQGPIICESTKNKFTNFSIKFKSDHTKIYFNKIFEIIDISFEEYLKERTINEINEKSEKKIFIIQ